ncbi:MAG TPA: Holliday junction resolvase RuvX [Candidatus Doudnabacteria bacterium]|nr:Holliday junction resolvase RuvX [Candidatus Doudnabacteria bacterium]
MKILAIDYGTKRIGLAISDELGQLARELSILSPTEFWDKIKDIVSAEEVEKIIVGLPINMSGDDTEKTLEARNFAEQLEQKISIPVELVDERLSSTMAEQIAGTSKDIDSLAAQIFLQNYLNSKQ